MVAERGAAINCCELNPLHGLLACGTDQGFVECFGPRSRVAVGGLDAACAVAAIDSAQVPAVTALSLSANGLGVAVGVSGGQVITYDIRSSKPLLIKDHNYDLPIKHVSHHTTGNIISADAKGIKIFDEETAKNFCTIETPADINDICCLKGTGLFFVANESDKVFTYFIPQLGARSSLPGCMGLVCSRQPES